MFYPDPGKLTITNKLEIPANSPKHHFTPPPSWLEKDPQERIKAFIKDKEAALAFLLGGRDVTIILQEDIIVHSEVLRLMCLEHNIELINDVVTQEGGVK